MIFLKVSCSSFATYESSAVDAECRFEVGRFVEVVFEALAHRMTVRSDEV